MTEPVQQYTLFIMGGKEFAIEIGLVVEILQRQEAMPVPNMPDFLVGIIDLRGRVIPVIDLRKRFHMAPVAKSKDRIIIVRKGRERLGMVVDNVMEIVPLESKGITAPPSIFKGPGSEYLKKIGKTGGRMIVILDVDRLLNREEMFMLNEAINSGAG
jgi:purine-binding chemotaxis protein CheW